MPFEYSTGPSDPRSERNEREEAELLRQEEMAAKQRGEEDAPRAAHRILPRGYDYHAKGR